LQHLHNQKVLNHPDSPYANTENGVRSFAEATTGP